MLAAAVAQAAARFRRTLADPAAQQRDHLLAIVHANRGSRFGRAHGFDRIADEAAFARQVPPRTYEELAPWIDASAAGRAGELTSEPVIAFEQTGGSTAGPRRVPYTAGGLAEFQHGLHAWLDDLFTAMPTLARGRFYWSISPVGRPPGRTASGLAIGLGSDAAYFGPMLGPLIADSLAVPGSVAAFGDMVEWRRHTLAHLFACGELSMISVWSPSFLSGLLDHAGDDLDAIAALMHGMRGEARERVALVEQAWRGATFEPSRLWPRLQLISCWDQASARGPADALTRRFPDVRIQGKGLLATEGLVSIPLHDQPCPVLALRSGYFEFRETGGRIRSAATVEDGGDYELLITNANGFYRYAIGDRVRVRGFAQRTPMLEFIGRDKACDLCGEKLGESFVLQALAPHALRFAALAAEAAQTRYLLLVDAQEVDEIRLQAIAEQVEAHLQRNPQYAYAQRLGQLQALAAVRVTDPIGRWTALRLAAGQRLGDIKLPALVADDAMRAGLLARAVT